MTLAVLERNTPPPSLETTLARILVRKGRALERDAIPALPNGSTLADHDLARAEGLKRLTGAELVLLSSLEAPNGPLELAKREAPRLEAMARATAEHATKGAKLSIRERLAGLAELSPARPWCEISALSRQQTNNASALRAARCPETGQVLDPAVLALHEFAEAHAAKLRNQRKLRYELRNVLREKSLQPRLQKCGQVILAPSEGVGIQQGDSGAFYSGLMACGSVWSCPCCAPKISRVRQGMVDQLLRRHLQRHVDGAVPSDELERGGAMMMTFTVSHRWGDELRPLRTAVSLVHRNLWGGWKGKALRARWGIIGHVRTLETTHGMNGWHPHLHCLVLTEGLLTDAEAEALRAELAERWCDLAEKAGLARPLEAQQHGELLHSPEDAARYITKYGEASELTGWTNKAGREGGRTPFQVLADYCELERQIARARDSEQPVSPDLRRAARHQLRLWRIWERDIKGARFLTWSTGLKQRYAILEQTDEEIAQAEERPAHPVMLLNRPLFQSLARSPKVLSALLDTAEREGGWAVAELLGSLPGEFAPGSRILTIYDSAALDRFRPTARSDPDGGITLTDRLLDCFLYEARILPSATITELAPRAAARKPAT